MLRLRKSCVGQHVAVRLFFNMTKVLLFKKIYFIWKKKNWIICKPAVKHWESERKQEMITLRNKEKKQTFTYRFGESVQREQRALKHDGIGYIEQYNTDSSWYEEIMIEI